MSDRQGATALKNLLVCAGLFYVARWVTLPLAFGFLKLTKGSIYTGDFQTLVVAPIVLRLPMALIASLVGVSVIWFVDSSRPVRWVMLVALTYAIFGLFGYHLAHEPTFNDRVFQAVGALFPAVICLLAGVVASRMRSRSQVASTPD